MRQWLDEMRLLDSDSPYPAVDPAVLGTPDLRRRFLGSTNVIRAS